MGWDGASRPYRRVGGSRVRASGGIFLFVLARPARRIVRSALVARGSWPRPASNRTHQFLVSGPPTGFIARAHGVARERPRPNAKRAQKPTELAGRPTARICQRACTPSTKRASTVATLKPFLCGLGATSLALCNRLLHCRMRREPTDWKPARTWHRAGSGGPKQSARRLGGPPGVARRAALLRGVSHAAMGGTGRPSNIRRGPPIP